MRYAFDDFTLDTETRQLFRAGREVPLPPKAYGLLELLVRLRPRAVSRTRLRTALWPDAHVGETSVHALVSQVRAVLGDDAQSPRYLRTVRDFGYAFAGEVKAESRHGRPKARGRRDAILAGDRAGEVPPRRGPQHPGSRGERRGHPRRPGDLAPSREDRRPRERGDTRGPGQQERDVRRRRAPRRPAPAAGGGRDPPGPALRAALPDERLGSHRDRGGLIRPQASCTRRTSAS